MNLFLGNLFGNLGTVAGNLAWEPVAGNLAWEPVAGNLAWERAWEPYL